MLLVFEPIPKRERHAAGARERTLMEPGLVRVERGGEVRGEIAEQVAEPRAVARVEMEQRLRIRIGEAPGDRPHRGVRALLDRAGSAKRGPGRPVPRGRERVPAGVDRAIDEGRVVLRAFFGAERVVVLVGVLRTRKCSEVVAPERRVHPADHIAGDPVVARLRERAMCLRIDGEQLGVLLKHLLVVRDLPFARGRVAEEPALDLVVHPSRGHRAKRLVEHRRQLGVCEAAMLVEDEAQHLGLRELRFAAETAELGVVLTADERADDIDDLPGKVALLRDPRLTLLFADLGDPLRQPGLVRAPDLRHL